MKSINEALDTLDENNKLTIRDTPSQEELKLLLDNRFNEDK